VKHWQPDWHPGLYRVRGRQVWGDNYRVNVYVGEDFASAKVAHSYFLEADSTGEVLTSTPAIIRLY